MATKMKWNFFWPDSIFATIVQVHSFVFLLPSIDQRFQKFVPRCFAGRIICTRLIFAPPHPGPTIEPPLFLIAQFAFCHPLFFFAMVIQYSLNISYWILLQCAMWLAKENRAIEWHELTRSFISDRILSFNSLWHGLSRYLLNSRQAWVGSTPTKRPLCSLLLSAFFECLLLV